VGEPDRTVIVRITGLVSGEPSPLDGRWLLEYDPTIPGRAPDGTEMTAHILTTNTRAAAFRFPDGAAALALWRAESGRPYPEDRPLTAFNIVLEHVPARR
jgi:hypothetical protein